MGNLSCVSCKDKNIQRSIGELSLGDFKGASFNKDLTGAGDKVTSELPAGDNQIDNEDRPTTPNEERVRFVKHAGNQRRTTAVELYEILQSQRLKARRPTPAPHVVHYEQRTFQPPKDDITDEEGSDDDESSEDEGKLEDVEKAAKGIVDMSVFLTTQVIYPAYLRYMKEDHPDDYTQYFERPYTPVPFDSAITVGGESS